MNPSPNLFCPGHVRLGRIRIRQRRRISGRRRHLGSRDRGTRQQTSHPDRHYAPYQAWPPSARPSALTFSLDGQTGAKNRYCYISPTASRVPTGRPDDLDGPGIKEYKQLRALSGPTGGAAGVTIAGNRVKHTSPTTVTSDSRRKIPGSIDPRFSVSTLRERREHIATLATARQLPTAVEKRNGN